jgi:hypothetical protein
VAGQPERFFEEDIKWDPDPNKTDQNKVFFNHVFPSLEVKATVASIAGSRASECSRFISRTVTAQMKR